LLKYGTGGKGEEEWRKRRGIADGRKEERGEARRSEGEMVIGRRDEEKRRNEE
jgi:hypothetical protein